MRTNKISDDYWLQKENSPKSVFTSSSVDIPADISIPSYQISSQWSASFNQGSNASSIYYQGMQRGFVGHVNHQNQAQNFYPRPSQPMRQAMALEVKIVENYPQNYYNAFSLDANHLPQNHYNAGSIDANHLLPNTSVMPSYCRQLNKPRVLTIKNLEFPKFRINERQEILKLTGIGIS